MASTRSRPCRVDVRDDEAELAHGQQPQRLLPVVASVTDNPRSSLARVLRSVAMSSTMRTARRCPDWLGESTSHCVLRLHHAFQLVIVMFTRGSPRELKAKPGSVSLKTTSI